MEQALVIYESMFGNTRVVAEAIAQGLSARFLTESVEVGAAPARIPHEVSLVVVGAPTHAFGLSRARTRDDAAKQAGTALVSPGIGLREWLSILEDSRRGIHVATFDTRIDKPRVPGSAARGAQKRLRRLGFDIVAGAESFYVTGTKGPLVPGEVERARVWGTDLARRIPAVQPEEARAMRGTAA